MERRLIIMRHAKSAHDDPTLADHQRPLNERGRQEAVEIAERLVEEGWIPDLVVSSDSLRTEQTWERMASVLGDDIPVEWDEDLYLAGTNAVSKVLGRVDSSVRTLLVLGHNPGWESALRFFSGEYHTLTTSNAALLEAEVASWKELVKSGSFSLHSLLRPRKD